MAIEFKASEIFSKFVPKQKIEGSYLSDILGHKRLFDFYGISCDELNTSPVNGTIELQTKDGVLYIDCNKRVIIAPLNYYSSERKLTNIIKYDRS